MSHLGNKPKQSLGHLWFAEWLRQTLPPWTAGDCTERVSGVHFGILTPYIYLINASGTWLPFFLSSFTINRGAQRKYFKIQYFNVISSSIWSLGNTRMWTTLQMLIIILAICVHVHKAMPWHIPTGPGLIFTRVGFDTVRREDLVCLSSVAFATEIGAYTGHRTEDCKPHR